MVAQLLVLYGADKKAVAHGVTPAQAAVSMNQPSIAEWFSTTVTWPPLQIAAGCRFYNEATRLLRQGRMDPDVLPLVQILAAIAASKAAPAALPWSNAPPICKQTIELVADATRGWNMETHWLYHATVRKAVFAVLSVAERFDREYDRLDEEEENAAPEAEVEAAGAAGASAHALGAVVTSSFDAPPLPLLPPEIWLYVMGFFLRSWWAVNEV